MTATHTYRYLAPSASGAAGISLQTSGGPDPHPRFFDGFLTAPRAAAAALLAVAEVARTRYYRPRDPASLDPVVTSGRDRLRFESFSGCCGVYARLDVLPAGLDGAVRGHGTTNVDVSAPLREALARVAGLDPLHLAVGPGDLTVSTMDGSIVERKVPLPPRWLRGFAEVHVLAAGFEPRAELSVADATAFLRRLPGAGDRSVLWAVPSGRTLRLTSRPAPGAVCVAGAGRLAALRGALRFATGLRAYGPPVGAASSPVASTWQVEQREQRISLTLSPEPYRGFSGEGAALTACASDGVADDAALVGALLSCDPTIDVAALARNAGLGTGRVLAALAHLGTTGRVGYDVAEAAYFHRVLPFAGLPFAGLPFAAVPLSASAGARSAAPAATARDSPRLVGARALLEAGAVAADGTVHSGREVYRVRRRPDGSFTCTCAWWGEYRGGRGPCRHALAVSVRAPA